MAAFIFFDVVAAIVVMFAPLLKGAFLLRSCLSVGRDVAPCRAYGKAHVLHLFSSALGTEGDGLGVRLDPTIFNVFELMAWECGLILVCSCTVELVS